MIHHLKRSFTTLLLALVMCGPALASDDIIYHNQERGSVSLGVEVNSGEYGTPNTITGVYMPLILTWFPTSRIDLGVEIPFVYQNTSYTTVGTSQTTVPVSTRRGARGIMATSSPTSTTTSGSADSSASGLGDLIFRAGVIAYFESDYVPQLRPSVYVKAPTADEAEGLGTGELDAGAGIEASKWIDDTHLTGEMFYNYQGKVAGLGLKNYFNYTAGAGYQITEQLQPMVLVKGSTATSSGLEAPLELRARLLWSMTKAATLDTFVSHGLSDSSPEYGGGVAMIYSF